MDPQPIRKTTWDGKAVEPRDIGELARDLQQKFSTIPIFKQLQLEGLYTEPLYVAYDHKPTGIVLLSIRQKDAQETPVLTGGMAHFVWEGTRCKVNSIDGMSIGSGNTFIYDLLMVG